LLNNEGGPAFIADGHVLGTANVFYTTHHS